MQKMNSGSTSSLGRMNLLPRRRGTRVEQTKCSTGHGSDFEDKHKRYRARSTVLEALKLASGKSTSKAADILYYAATKLEEASVKAKLDFDEYSILGKQAVYNHKLYSRMMERVKECIGGMK